MQMTVLPYQGYVYGAIQPSVLFRFSALAETKPELLAKLDALFQSLPQPKNATEFQSQTASWIDGTAPHRMLQCLDALNHAAGDQRFTPITVFSEGDQTCYLLPTLSTELTGHSIQAMRRVLQAEPRQIRPDTLKPVLDSLRQRAKALVPAGTNAPHFLTAAASRRIPMFHLTNRHIIFGYGSGSHIFNSSITEHDSSIGVSIAKNKVSTNQLLRLSGLPVAPQARVANLNDALKAAASFGYPVVLKPENEDQGRGVSANILDADELTKRFTDTHRTYPHLIVEKHISGDHHRFTFADDLMLISALRRPARVIGDGHSTIQALIETLNQHPDRSGPYPVSNPVLVDEDVHDTLMKQGHRITDVLPEGTEAVLRSLSNRSLGGYDVDVATRVHPENYNLLKTVATTFRLRVVGIDLISKDISEPWFANGAVILEVNAQPQMRLPTVEAFWRFLSHWLSPQPLISLRIVPSNAPQSAPLFDKTRQRLELRVRANDIRRNGSPVQYFQSLSFDDDVSLADRQAIERMLESVLPLEFAPELEPQT